MSPLCWENPCINVPPPRRGTRLLQLLQAKLEIDMAGIEIKFAAQERFERAEKELDSMWDDAEDMVTSQRHIFCHCCSTWSIGLEESAHLPATASTASRFGG